VSEIQAKQQRIRELLEKLEGEIKDCRRILRGEAPLD